MMNSNKDYLYNTIAGLINASEAVVMSLIVTRISGLADAGYLSVAFAVGNQLLCVGTFGIYGYQVTDIKGEFSYLTYKNSRIASVICMFICLCIYLLYGQNYLSNNLYKTIIIFIIGIIYVIEAIENLIIGFCQRIGKLHVGSKMFIARWISILLSFTVVTFYSRSTLKGLAFSLFISFFVFILCSIYVVKKHLSFCHNNSFTSEANNDLHYRENKGNTIFRLFHTTYPLFLSAFLSFYINNVSKYALDHLNIPQIQACYGFISMPVFAISLLNGFIYKPTLVPMAIEYNSNKIDQLHSRIKKQFLIILFMSISGVFLSYLIGIPFLSWLFNADLSNYKLPLVVLILASGFLAATGYQTAIITIIRKQHFILYGYIPVAIFAFFSTNLIVSKYGVIGASLSYLSLVIFLNLIYGVFLFHELKIAQSFSHTPNK